MSHLYPNHPYTFHPRRVNPISQITPFTMRDGATYLTVMESLRDYITHVAVPELLGEINRVHGEFQVALNSLEDARKDDVARWQSSFNAFMTNVEEEIKELSDHAMSRVFEDSESDSFNALNRMFPSHDIVNSAISNIRDKVNDSISDLESSVNSSISSLESSVSSDINDMDSRLDSAVSDVNSSISSLESSVSSDINDMDSRLDSAMSDINNTISNIQTALNIYNVDVVRSDNVDRIVVSDNYDEPISKGQLLIVRETPSFFNNFSHYALEESPGDWSTPWDNCEMSVVAEQSATHGKALRIAGIEAGYRVASWNVPTDHAIDHTTSQNDYVEVAVKWRPVSGSPTNVGFRIYTHVNGVQGYEFAYYGGKTSSGSLVIGFINGGEQAQSVIEDETETVHGDWVITKVRFDITGSSVKYWKYTHLEPEDNNRRGRSTLLDSGGIGLAPTGGSPILVDWISVSVGGGNAVMGE